MTELLKDKDIIIAILAFIAPVFALVEVIIGNIFENKKNKRAIVENRKDRDNNRKNEVYCKLLDTICELEICKTKIFDDEYYRVLLHHFNSVSLYANKFSREKIKECKDYFEECRAKYFSNIPSREKYIRDFCEYEINNIVAAEYHYDEEIMDLKVAAIELQKITTLLDALIETMNNEITV